MVTLTANEDSVYQTIVAVLPNMTSGKYTIKKIFIPLRLFTVLLASFTKT